jgi:hypothetical protein
MSTIPDPIMPDPVIPDPVIPNSVLLRAKANQPLKRPRPRNVAANLTRVATYPTLVALGLAAMAFERLRNWFEHGWLKT